jgi:glutaminyl-peptide cyclotransferase
MHDEMAALGEGGTPEMDMGVQVIFLDGKYDTKGQEAYFGSKLVAPTLTVIYLKLTEYSALSQHVKQQLYPNGLYATALDQIKMFVLLDNLGLPDPVVPSLWEKTQAVHEKLVAIETRMLSQGDNSTVFPNFPFFTLPNNEQTISSVNDDTAFDKLGVPCLRIAPKAVETAQDDSIGNIEFPLVQRWAMMLQAFALEWLDMVS